jgi:hypothetical protein
MFELYKAECRRFARSATGIGVLHLVALLFLDRLFPGLRDDGEVCDLLGAAYGVSGAILGVYQAASYARMNHWITLLHRPLAPWRIMLAVSGAGATIVCAAILLPLLLFTAGQAVQVGRVVDARHWLLAVAAALIAAIGFLTGSCAALAPRRYGWTVVVAVAILTAGNTAVGAGALLCQAGIVVILSFLLAGAFKPDRARAPTNPALLALTAGVAALSVYFLLLIGGGFLYQMSLVAIARNPLINLPSPGGLVEASRADGDDLIAAALRAAHTPAADAVRARLTGVVARIPVAMEALPAWGELTNSGPITFADPSRSIAWTFSHDARAFRGIGQKDLQPAGELRPAGAFEAPPLRVENMMIAGGSLYVLDASRGTLERRLRLPDGEVIVARPRAVGPTLPILGNRALHLFDKTVLDGAAPRAVAVPLPGAIGDLRRLDLARLPDVTIVSFFFGRDSIEGPASAWQSVMSVTPDGAVHTLARRSFDPEFSDVLRYRAYWLSPTIHAVASAAEDIGGIASPVRQRAPVQVPRRVWVAAIMLSIIAALCTAFVARRRRLSAMSLAAWSLATLALGLPMFFAFWLVGKRRA